MKTKNELNALKDEEKVNTEEKGTPLTDEELSSLAAGDGIKIPTIWPPRTLPKT